jgi:hypothetical protein
MFAYTIQCVTLLSHDNSSVTNIGDFMKDIATLLTKEAVILPYVSHISIVNFRALNVCGTLPPFHWKTF